MNLILASASARRHELLKRLTDKFSVIVSDFDEESVKFQGDCEAYVKELAKGKAFSVGRVVKEEAVIIGCDTVVFYDNKVLEKPKSKDEAFKMLKMLSGNVHQVYSGIVLYCNTTGKFIEEVVKTDVKFSVIEDEEINTYVDSGEPMDKAGAYGIQGIGGVFVEEISGCYYNVVGLPLNKLKFLLKNMRENLFFSEELENGR